MEIDNENEMKEEHHTKDSSKHSVNVEEKSNGRITSINSSISNSTSPRSGCDDGKIPCLTETTEMDLKEDNSVTLESNNSNTGSTESIQRIPQLRTEQYHQNQQSQQDEHQGIALFSTSSSSKYTSSRRLPDSATAAALGSSTTNSSPPTVPTTTTAGVTSVRFAGSTSPVARVAKSHTLHHHHHRPLSSYTSLGSPLVPLSPAPLLPTTSTIATTSTTTTTTLANTTATTDSSPALTGRIRNNTASTDVSVATSSTNRGHTKEGAFGPTNSSNNPVISRPRSYSLGHVVPSSTLLSANPNPALLTSIGSHHTHHPHHPHHPHHTHQPHPRGTTAMGWHNPQYTAHTGINSISNPLHYQQLSPASPRSAIFHHNHTNGHHFRATASIPSAPFITPHHPTTHTSHSSLIRTANTLGSETSSGLTSQRMLLDDSYPVTTSAASTPSTPSSSGRTLIGTTGENSDLMGQSKHPGALNKSKENVVSAAMALASSKERERIQSLEREEESVTTVEELRKILKRERHRTLSIVVELAALKCSTVQHQYEMEVLEESRVNVLMRHLSTLKSDKERIILELEREEEMLTNTMLRKLDQVRREKALLEQKLERGGLSSSSSSPQSRESMIKTTSTTKTMSDTIKFTTSYLDSDSFDEQNQRQKSTEQKLLPNDNHIDSLPILSAKRKKTTIQAPETCPIPTKCAAATRNTNIKSTSENDTSTTQKVVDSNAESITQTLPKISVRSNLDDKEPIPTIFSSPKLKHDHPRLAGHPEEEEEESCEDWDDNKDDDIDTYIKNKENALIVDDIDAEYD